MIPARIHGKGGIALIRWRLKTIAQERPAGLAGLVELAALDHGGARLPGSSKR
jgi:hypothetical protein